MTPLNIQVAKGICAQRKKGNVYEQVDMFKNLSRGLPKSLWAHGGVVREVAWLKIKKRGERITTKKQGSSLNSFGSRSPTFVSNCCTLADVSSKFIACLVNQCQSFIRSNLPKFQLKQLQFFKSGLVTFITVRHTVKNQMEQYHLEGAVNTKCGNIENWNCEKTGTSKTVSLNLK